jgi:sugar O-acyltransferase (sialic acid O-acetyltransferase NeuD family)
LDLYIYCAGGLGKEIHDLALRINYRFKHWDSILFIDDVLFSTECIDIMNFEKFIEVPKDQHQVVVANGEPEHRATIRRRLVNSQTKLAYLVDPSCVVSPSAELRAGAIVSALCSISTKALLMENCFVNVMSIVGHDVIVGEDTVISSHVNLGGGVVIGDRTYIGMGTQIKERICIGSDVIIGMGSVVHTDIPDGMIALGNPARVMRRNDDRRVFR